MDGVRHKGGINLIQPLVLCVGSCRPDAKGEIQVETCEDESTDAGHSGGAACISDEDSYESE